MTTSAATDMLATTSRTAIPAGQRLLRPDQAAAAVMMTSNGEAAEAVADALAVPVEVVLRSLRLPAVHDLVAPESMVLGRVLVVGERLSVRHLSRPLSWRAPVYVTDNPGWPAPAVEADRWQVVAVREGRHVHRRALREVALWDAPVLVDEDRRVFCVLCRRLVEVVELGRSLFRGQDGISGGGLPTHTLELPPPRAA